MKKNKKQNEFLEQLKKIPIVSVAAEKTGLSRNSIYRWKRDDKEFEKAMGDALAEGEALINDMSESQLLSLIKDKSWQAISFWLRHRNPKFRERVEVTTKIEDSEVLTLEQEALVRKALELASITPPNEVQNNGEQNDSAGTGGENA